MLSRNAILILLTAMFSSSALHAQLEDGCHAAFFGIDGDLYANFSAYGNGAGTSPSDDWFADSSLYSGIGTGVISTDSLAIWNDPNLPNFHLVGSMSLPSNSIYNGIRWLEGIYVRDYYGGNGSTDLTSYTSASKNGEDPLVWDTGPANVTPKNDIIDSYGHMRRDGTTIDDDMWLMAGFSRISNSGASYLDAELFIETLVYDPATGFSSAGPHEGHTAWIFDADGNILSPGDLVLSVVFNTSTVPEIQLRIWTSRSDYQNVTPSTFNFGSEFDGASATSVYGYASILTPSGSMVSCGKANDGATKGPPWGTLDPNGNFTYDYDTWQFLEIAVNLTEFGIDPAFIIGPGGDDPCRNPYGTILFKARASASFTAQLKDFSGPFTFDEEDEHPPIIGDTLSCYTPQVWLTPGLAVNGTNYSWETIGGNILTNPNRASIMVDQEGYYILTQSEILGCAETHDTIFVPDISIQVDVDITADTVWGCTLETVLNGSSNGNYYSWSGPNGFTSNDSIIAVIDSGLYILNVQDTISGCWGADSIYVSRITCEDIDPGTLPYDGNLAVMWDSIMPTFTVPADITIDCNMDPSALKITGDVVDESDDCTVDIGDATYQDSIEVICGGEMDISRTWSLTDDCGNTFTAVQHIYLIDTLAPSFDPPADITINCSQNPNNLNLTGTPTNIVDNCDPEIDTFAFTNVTVIPCAGERVITRTWSIQDECGNTSYGTQVITMIDTIAPTFTVPADITLDCTTDINDLTFTGDVTDESDNCDNYTGQASYTDNLINGPCPNEYVVERTWSLSDACGNTFSGVQQISLIDTVPPFFITVPSDTTVDCYSIPAPVNPVVGDACTAFINLILNETTVDGDCVNRYTIHRTWTATDVCGNSATATQILQVEGCDPFIEINSGNDIVVCEYDPVVISSQTGYTTPVY